METKAMDMDEAQIRSEIERLDSIVLSLPPFLAGHSVRTARYSRLLAERCSKLFPETTIDLFELERSAFWHDIGKRMIGMRLLVKEDKLNDCELREIRRHVSEDPQILASIFREVERCWPGLAATAYEVCAHHHEWYNGSGYPEGLAKDKIALTARIVAVADAYDAMTAQRPYRSAVSHKRALTEIGRSSKIQFDPEIAALFIEIGNTVREVCEEFGGYKMRDI